MAVSTGSQAPPPRRPLKRCLVTENFIRELQNAGEIKLARILDRAYTAARQQWEVEDEPKVEQ